MLTLRAKMFLRDGQTYGKNRRAFMFDVLGLPDGKRAEIAERRRKWQIRRVDNEVHGEWFGQYGSAEEALASLS